MRGVAPVAQAELWNCLESWRTRKAPCIPAARLVLICSGWPCPALPQGDPHLHLLSIPHKAVGRAGRGYAPPGVQTLLGGLGGGAPPRLAEPLSQKEHPGPCAALHSPAHLRKRGLASSPLTLSSVASSCIRGGLDWKLGEISLLREWSDIGPGCPGNWWSHRPWRGSKTM